MPVGAQLLYDVSWGCDDANAIDVSDANTIDVGDSEFWTWPLYPSVLRWWRAGGLEEVLSGRPIPVVARCDLKPMIPS